jgi:hypothetical protein
LRNLAKSLAGYCSTDGNLGSAWQDMFQIAIQMPFRFQQIVIGLQAEKEAFRHLRMRRDDAATSSSKVSSKKPADEAKSA